MKAKGFSEAVIARLDKVHAATTNKVYLSQWTLFEAWCRDRDLNPLAATSVCLCDFFLYLFQVRNLKPSTIEGYKSALSFILKRAAGYDLSQCEILADMIKSFKVERPHHGRVVVEWDIAVVLEFLQSDRFLFEQVSPRDLTIKTAFLLALALGKRRSELHAIERASVRFAEEGDSVTLKPTALFLSKTHISSKGVGAFKSARVPALPHPPRPGEAQLCPVMCLKQYLLVSDKYRTPKQRRLFISFRNDRHTDIASSTLSGYIKSAIVDAYKRSEHLPDSVLQDKYRVKAHQVRHVAHSLGQLGTLPLSEIIRTGGWTSENTFIKFYLQDVSEEASSRLAKVGSFVAIESVFEPNKSVTF